MRDATHHTLVLSVFSVIPSHLQTLTQNIHFDKSTWQARGFADLTKMNNLCSFVFGFGGYTEKKDDMFLFRLCRNGSFKGGSLKRKLKI